MDFMKEQVKQLNHEIIIKNELPKTLNEAIRNFTENFEYIESMSELAGCKINKNAKQKIISYLTDLYKYEE